MKQPSTGCNCSFCAAKWDEEYKKARSDWDNGMRREVVLRPWDSVCSEGCCSDYGTELIVNGLSLSTYAEDGETTAQLLLNFLGIEGAIVSTDMSEE